MYLLNTISFTKKPIPPENARACVEFNNAIEKENFRVKRCGVDGLSELNNFLFKLIDEKKLWTNIPADTRFPGYFSSLADHVIATTSVAVPLAVEVFKQGYDFGRDYESDSLKNALREDRGLVEITRFLSLFHDIGKHPPNGHCERTEECIKNILKRFSLYDEFHELAESASRHHYGQYAKEDNKPRTKLEWIVAFADKVSSTQERGVSGSFATLHEPYKWLLEVEQDNANKRRIEKILNLESTSLEKYSEDPEIYTLLPINISKIQKLDEKIFNASSQLGNAKIGVFCLEIAGIQKFITASDFRKYISGASTLIDDALSEVKKEIEKILCPECVIYAKGGSLLAIIPPSYLEKIRERACKIFEEKTKVVNLKLPKNIEFELWELKYGPKIFWSDDYDADILLKLTERRNFGSVASSVISSLESTEKVGKPETIKIGEICPVCNEYAKSGHKHLIDDEEEYVCERCYFVIEKHNKSREVKQIIQINIETGEVSIPYYSLDFDTSYSRIVWKVKDALEKRLKTNPVIAEYHSKGVNVINFAPIKTWNYLGRQHLAKDHSDGDDEVYNVAFIKGDGDNFGKIKSSMPSIALYRQISKLFEDVIEGCIAEALAEIMIKQLEIRVERDVKDGMLLDLPFDIVFVGGDDFLLLIDAAFIFVFLTAFRKKLQAMLGNRKREFTKKDVEPLSVVPLGVSIGIAIVKNRMPFKSTLDVVSDLLYRAKRKSRSDDGKFGAEVFVSLKKFEAIPSKEEINETFGSGFTQFPTSGEDLIGFIEDLKFFVQNNVSPNWIRRAFGGSTEPIDAYVNLLYKMARTKKDEWEWLKKLEDMHKDGLKHIENFAFKHFDVAESLEIIGGKLSAEGFSDEKVRRIMMKLLGG
jgi:GGDEF domain-containing protein